MIGATDSPGAAQLLSAIREMLGPPGKALEAKLDGAKIRMHYVLPPEMMRFAQSQAASVSFADQLQPFMGMLGLPGSSGAAPPAKAPPPPSNGGKIMIYGLDDGPRESKDQINFPPQDHNFSLALSCTSCYNTAVIPFRADLRAGRLAV